MDVRAYNRRAWDQQVAQGNQWTLPVGPDVIAAARRGEWGILLTPTKPVPRSWFPPDLVGLDVLCLASGGGQQGPVLAAAGATVTVYDNSPAQLAQDRGVAAREELDIKTVEGDMADLGAFTDASFDLIVHPVSNNFVPAVRPVWAEAFRVLRPGGVLLVGIANPVRYLFEDELADDEGALVVRHRLPYADVESLTATQRAKYEEKGWPLEFSHTLESQIGGQLEVGFLLAALYEDGYGSAADDPLSAYMETFIAMRSLKPAA